MEKLDLYNANGEKLDKLIVLGEEDNKIIFKSKKPSEVLNEVIKFSIEDPTGSKQLKELDKITFTFTAKHTDNTNIKLYPSQSIYILHHKVSF